MYSIHAYILWLTGVCIWSVTRRRGICLRWNDSSRTTWYCVTRSSRCLLREIFSPSLTTRSSSASTAVSSPRSHSLTHSLTRSHFSDTVQCLEGSVKKGKGKGSSLDIAPLTVLDSGAFLQPRKWQLTGIDCSTAAQPSGCP